MCHDVGPQLLLVKSLSSVVILYHFSVCLFQATENLLYFVKLWGDLFIPIEK